MQGRSFDRMFWPLALHLCDSLLLTEVLRVQGCGEGSHLPTQGWPSLFLNYTNMIQAHLTPFIVVRCELAVHLHGSNFQMLLPKSLGICYSEHVETSSPPLCYLLGIQSHKHTCVCFSVPELPSQQPWVSESSRVHCPRAAGGV